MQQCHREGSPEPGQGRSENKIKDLKPESQVCACFPSRTCVSEGNVFPVCYFQLLTRYYIRETEAGTGWGLAASRPMEQNANLTAARDPCRSAAPSCSKAEAVQGKSHNREGAAANVGDTQGPGRDHRARGACEADLLPKNNSPYFKK